jgi:hypothetical protein
MNASLLAVLNDNERQLVAETEPAERSPLGEDEAIELQARIRRAQNRYAGLYPRPASARVAEKGGRGKARPAHERAAMKAEAFEEALSRVSRRVAILARQSAMRLRRERIELARGAQSGKGTGADVTSVPADGGLTDLPLAGKKASDGALRSLASERRRASMKAAGARRQAKRDSR